MSVVHHLQKVVSWDVLACIQELHSAGSSETAVFTYQLHGITAQNTAIFIVTAVMTSHHTPITVLFVSLQVY
jgi:hypothetical protein